LFERAAAAGSRRYTKRAALASRPLVERF